MLQPLLLIVLQIVHHQDKLSKYFIDDDGNKDNIMTYKIDSKELKNYTNMWIDILKNDKKELICKNKIRTS